MSRPNLFAKAICFSDGIPKSDTALKRASMQSSIIASATLGLQPVKSKPSWTPNNICASLKIFKIKSFFNTVKSYQHSTLSEYINITRFSIALFTVTSTGFAARAETSGYYAVQNFSCSYVSTAFEDERNFRKTMDPPPHPEALTTLQTRELAQFVAGFLTAWNAISEMYDVRDEVYNAYPPGLTAALYKINAYCTSNRTNTIIDGLYDILTSSDANPIKKE